VILACSGLLALGSGACTAPGTDVGVPAPAVSRSAAERGRGWFEAYCSECHGSTAKGGGPLAAGMRPPPADLTRIAARRGRFVADSVAAYIDGRLDVERHGPRGMPVWGRKLDDRLERALEEEMKLSPQMIADLVAYLETRQGL
jgi:mono/diheme cytochrome c family protein